MRRAESVSDPSSTILLKESVFRWTRKTSILTKVQIFFAELLGTTTYVFIGCSGCIVSPAGGTNTTQNVSLTFGFGFMISLMLFAHISKGHFNPILTITSVIIKIVPLDEFAIYLVAQFAGAFAGFGLVLLVTPPKEIEDRNVGLCSPYMNDQINNIQGFVCEFVISAMLTAYACMVWDKYRDYQDSLSLRFGLVVGCLTLAALPYTGANMNPARSLAPAAINGNWDDHWVYWAAPISASILIPVAYRLLAQKDEDEDDLQSIR